MREDTSVHPLDIFLLSAFVVAFVMNSDSAFRPGADNLNWEMRWRGLDELARAWLAVASDLSADQATLEQRGELDLAKGYSRRERRRLAYLNLVTLPFFIAGAALVVMGVLPSATLGLIVGVFGLVQALAGHLRHQRTKDRYRKVQARYLATPHAEAVV